MLSAIIATQHRIDVDTFLLTLYRDGIEGKAKVFVSNVSVSDWTDDVADSIRFALSLKSRGKVDRVTQASIVEALIAAHVPNDDSASINTKPHTKSRDALFRDFIIELL